MAFEMPVKVSHWHGTEYLVGTGYAWNESLSIKPTNWVWMEREFKLKVSSTFITTKVQVLELS